MSSIPEARSRAIPSRETRAKLRVLGRRIKGIEHPELARAAVAIQALARGETIDVRHFPAECMCERKVCWFREFDRPLTIDELEWWDGESARPCPHRTIEEIDAGRRGPCCLCCDLCEHVPLNCQHCGPLLWVAWVIGVGTEGDLPDLAIGLPLVRRADGTVAEDWQAEIIRRARDGAMPPAWFWDWDDAIDVAAYDRMIEPRDELVREIRFGSDPRAAKRAARAASRKEMNLNILLKRDDP